MADTVVMSLGGSIVAPDGVDTDFVAKFRETILAHLEEDGSRRVILVVGGGKLAREYQAACRAVLGPDAEKDAQDWVGVAATRLNAQYIKAVFGSLCVDEVVSDPTGDIAFDGRMLVASGWKPGFSTDYDGVLLADRFGSPSMINLTDLEQVHTADPRVDPSAKPIDTMTWPEFRKLVGDEWVPGKNAPFDPIAARKAEELGVQVVSTLGTDMKNLASLISGGSFVGTRIGPR